MGPEWVAILALVALFVVGTVLPVPQQTDSGTGFTFPGGGGGLGGGFR